MDYTFRHNILKGSLRIYSYFDMVIMREFI